MKRSRLETVFLPPAIATAFVILFGVWVFWSESTSPPRFIEGRVDNAPTRAAAILVILTPFLFAFLVAAQAIAYKLSGGRMGRILSVYTGGIILVASGIGLLSLSSGDELSKAAEGFALFFFLGFCLTVPMALTTWWAFRRPLHRGPESFSSATNLLR